MDAARICIHERWRIDLRQQLNAVSEVGLHGKPHDQSGSDSNGFQSSGEGPPCTGNLNSSRSPRRLGALSGLLPAPRRPVDVVNHAVN